MSVAKSTRIDFVGYHVSQIYDFCVVDHLIKTTPSAGAPSNHLHRPKPPPSRFIVANRSRKCKTNRDSDSDDEWQPTKKRKKKADDKGILLCSSQKV